MAARERGGREVGPDARQPGTRDGLEGRGWARRGKKEKGKREVGHRPGKKETWAMESGSHPEDDLMNFNKFSNLENARNPKGLLENTKWSSNILEKFTEIS